jgi:hypothetical protein
LNEAISLKKPRQINKLVWEGIQNDERSTTSRRAQEYEAHKESDDSP